jgi:hypothetical protein
LCKNWTTIRQRLLWWIATYRGKTYQRSEKASAYKMKLEAMNRQGQRNDLTRSQVGNKSRLYKLIRCL